VTSETITRNQVIAILSFRNTWARRRVGSLGIHLHSTKLGAHERISVKRATEEGNR
jgi:hypothetical protein